MLENIGIKQDLSYKNIRKVPREMLKTVVEGQGFQQLLRDLANVTAMTEILIKRK